MRIHNTECNNNAMFTGIPNEDRQEYSSNVQLSRLPVEN